MNVLYLTGSQLYAQDIFNLGCIFVPLISLHKISSAQLLWNYKLNLTTDLKFESVASEVCKSTIAEVGLPVSPVNLCGLLGMSSVLFYLSLFPPADKRV